MNDAEFLKKKKKDLLNFEKGRYNLTALDVEQALQL